MRRMAGGSTTRPGTGVLQRGERRGFDYAGADVGVSDSGINETLTTGAKARRTIVAALGLTLWAGLAWAQQPTSPTDRVPGTPEALQAEIGALKADRVAWREISWKTCLLDGLRESRASGRPV